jgi:hypothetical protein
MRSSHFPIRCFPTDSPMLQIRIIYANRLFRRIDKTANPVWTTFRVLALGFTQNDVQLIDAAERHSGWRVDGQFVPFVVEHLKVKRRAAPCKCIFQRPLKVSAPCYGVMNFRSQFDFTLYALFVSLVLLNG